MSLLWVHDLQSRFVCIWIFSSYASHVYGSLESAQKPHICDLIRILWQHYHTSPQISESKFSEMRSGLGSFRSDEMSCFSWDCCQGSSRSFDLMVKKKKIVALMTSHWICILLLTRSFEERKYYLHRKTGNSDTWLSLKCLWMHDSISPTGYR